MHNKIVDYQIIAEKYDTGKLVKEVRDMIEIGYIPHGSLVYGGDDYMYQAMVKIAVVEGDLYQAWERENK